MQEQPPLNPEFIQSWAPGDPPELLMKLAGYSTTHANSEFVIDCYDEFVRRAYIEGKDITTEEQNRAWNTVRKRLWRNRKNITELRQSAWPTSFRNGYPIDSRATSHKTESDVRDCILEMPIELQNIAEGSFLEGVKTKDLTLQLNIPLRTFFRRKATVLRMLRIGLVEYSPGYRE